MPATNIRPWHRHFGAVVFCMVVSGLPLEASAVSDAEVELLRKEIAELRVRVEKLEGKVASGVAVNPARKVQPVEGGWRVAHNWNLLNDGMEQHRVVEILGEPEDTRRVGKFEFWRYGKGQVKLYQGRVSSWDGP